MTPTLKQYIESTDRNKFWSISDGERENLLDEAIELLLELEQINKDMHSQVSGYLHGEDWKHWQEHNAERFKVNSISGNDSNTVKVIMNDTLREIVEQAYIAGQSDTRLGPSYSNARAYFDRVFSVTTED